MTKNLCAPSATELLHVQKLCELSSPYLPPSDTQRTFNAAMSESVRWHRDRSPFYARLLEQSDFSLSDFGSGKRGLESLPVLPADLFKRHEILSIPRESVSLHSTSSGTTGQKSQIFFNEWSIGSAQRMVDWIFKYYGWEDSRPTNYLLYSYQSEADLKLGTAFTDNFLCKYAPVKQLDYALKLNGRGGHDFDVFGCLNTLQEYARQGDPVRIFGFPAFLHFTLDRMEQLGLAPLKLHPDSLVFLGGGWKGHAAQSLGKDSLYAQVEKWLGIPNSRLRDGFGSVEHCVPYIECAHHHFHVPTWPRVIIRDFKDLHPVDFGRAGFLQYVSPYITSVPAHSVMMGDAATLHASCACGLPTPWFEIHGRAGTSKNRSCAVAASEILQRTAEI